MNDTMKIEIATSAGIVYTADARMVTLPAVTKHLKVLERAGLISRSRLAQARPCHLEAGPLRTATDWMVQYRHMWEGRLDRLDAFLKQASGHSPSRGAQLAPGQLAIQVLDSWPIRGSIGVVQHRTEHAVVRHAFSQLLLPRLPVLCLRPRRAVLAGDEEHDPAHHRKYAGRRQSRFTRCPRIADEHEVGRVRRDEDAAAGRSKAAALPRLPVERDPRLKSERNKPTMGTG